MNLEELDKSDLCINPDKLEKEMDEYLDNVTKEQLIKDLEEVGIKVILKGECNCMEVDAITIYKIEKHYTTKFRIPDKKKVHYSVNISNSGEHHQIKGEKHFNESIIEDMTLREVKKAIIKDLKE